MSVKGIIGFRGMKPSGNELALPPGSLVDALDCVIPAQDELMPRRGQAQSTYIDNDSADANGNRAKEMYQWGNNLLVQYHNGGGDILAIWKSWATAPTFASLGAFSEPDPTVTRMKFAELARSLYWTTSAGLYALDTASGTARRAGMHAPLILMGDTDGGLFTRLAGNVSAVGSWYAKNKQVAYRATLAKKDANGKVIESRASGRVIVVNPNDVPVSIGNLVRNANVVTATVTAHKFRAGDLLSLILTGADIGNFNQNNNLVTAVTATTIKWAQVAANYASVATATIISGTKSVQVAVGFVSGTAIAGDFIQLYRTDESAGEAIDPGDEVFLAYERSLTATDISNGYAVIPDTTPADWLGDPLDSNKSSGEGPLGDNERPPVCRDLCRWDGRLWGLETTDRHRLRLRLLGIGTPNGLQAGDLIAVNTRVFVAGTVASPVNFNIYDQYLPTENVERTTYELSLVLNVLTDIGLDSHLEHDGDTGLGEVLVEQTYPAGSMVDGSSGAISFIYGATSRTSAWADPLPTLKALTAAGTARLASTVTVQCAAHGFVQGQVVMLARTYSSATDANFPLGLKTIVQVPDANHFTYTEAGAAVTLDLAAAYYAYATTYKSDNNRQLMRFSRPGLPDAWPLANTPDGFPDGAEGYRVTQLGSGDGLLVALKNGGFYTVTGSYPYSVRLLDDTADLVAPDSLKKHNGALYGLTTQGICTIGEAGVGIVGSDVEDKMRLIVARILDGSVSAVVPFGVSYESDRQYLLFVPIETNEGIGPSTGIVTADARQALVLHSMLGQFTRWSMRRTCGLVWKGGNYLVLGDTATNRLQVERKALTQFDFVDKTVTVQVDGDQTAVTTIVVIDSMNLGAGDAVNINGQFYRITAVAAHSITVDTAVTVTNGLFLTGYVRYSPTFTWAVDSRGTPGVESRWRQIQLHFKERFFNAMTLTFKGEKSDTTGDVIVSGGTDTILRLSTLRAKVPDNFERVALQQVKVRINEAFGYFRLLGYSGSAEPITERTGQ